MSMYPQAASGQGLYDSSDTPKARVGTEFGFLQAEGVVYARYMQNANAASIANGLVVAYALDVDAGPYAFDTAPLAATNAVGAGIAGILCASVTVGGYAWVAFRGPVTGAKLAASVASNVVSHVSVNSLAQCAVIASTLATANEIARERIIGRLGATASTISATTTGASGHYVMVDWR